MKRCSSVKLNSLVVISKVHNKMQHFPPHEAPFVAYSHLCKSAFGILLTSPVVFLRVATYATFCSRETTPVAQTYLVNCIDSKCVKSFLNC